MRRSIPVSRQVFVVHKRPSRDKDITMHTVSYI